MVNLDNQMPFRSRGGRPGEKHELNGKRVTVQDGVELTREKESVCVGV